MHEFTDAEQGMLGQARTGDLVSLMGLILKVVEVRPNGIDMMEQGCEWAVRCASEATQLIPHPILTYVPACDRCARNAGCVR